MANRWMQAAATAMKRKGTEGSFTREAKAHGMGVQAYANKVLAKGSKASTKTKKRASFAKAAGKVARKRK